jgi:hypothetical protein
MGGLGSVLVEAEASDRNVRPTRTSFMHEKSGLRRPLFNSLLLFSEYQFEQEIVPRFGSLYLACFVAD